MDKLTAKQEAFCLNFFKTNDAGGSALLAGYSPHFVAQNCGKTLKNPKIVSRLAELRSLVRQTVGDTVMDVAERQQRLSEIARARLVDFIKDGDPELNAEIPNNGAASEYSTRTTFVKEGVEVVSKTLKLRDPVSAIAELNKMDHTYDERPTVTNNTQINIIVRDEETKELVRKLLAGGRSADVPTD